jgi:putative transferase (TIGR04331 family)
MHENKYELLDKGRKIYKSVYYPLVETLNIIHNTKKQFEWTIFIQYWLNSFIFFYLLNKKKSYFTNFNYNKIKILNNDYLDFYSILSKKKFKILFFYINKNINKKNFDYFLKFLYGNNIRLINIISKIFNLKFFLIKFFVKILNSSIFLSVATSKELQKYFFFKTKFKLLFLNPIPNIEYKKEKKNCDTILRKKAYKIFLEINQNKIKDKKLVKLIFIFLPLAYLENFKDIKYLVKSMKDLKPKNIFFDGVEAYNEPLKLLIGYWALNGTKIINVQHSGSDIDLKLDVFYEYYRRFCNNYISWGWKVKNSNILAQPSLRLYIQIKKIKKEKNKKYDIIFFPSNIQFSQCSYGLNDLVKKKILAAKMKLLSFYNKKKFNFYLKTKLEDEIIIRRSFGNVQILNNKYLSTELYSKTKISIFDNISTGFFECLFSFQPAIIFLPNKNFLLYQSKSYKKISSILIKYKLIFYNPKDIENLLKNYDENKFTNTYSKLIKDKNFNTLFYNPNYAKTEWLKFFSKVL